MLLLTKITNLLVFFKIFSEKHFINFITNFLFLAQKAFVSLALFNILRFPLAMLPNLGKYLLLYLSYFIIF